MNKFTRNFIQTYLSRYRITYHGECSKMTHRLLQVLSHPVKLEILKVITTEPEPVEKIAQKVDISVEETKVHLDRLHEAGLVDADPEGTYRAGPFGQLILSLLLDRPTSVVHRKHWPLHSAGPGVW